MTPAPPAGSTCPSHPETPAQWTCPRCGRFMCQACERRTRPDAMPMCPSCWELRAQKVEPQTPSKARLQNLGLGFGIASLMPFWPLLLISLILNVVALVKASGDPELQAHRWKPIVGLCVTLVSIAGWIVLIFLTVRI